jgi:hypothetical protein
MTDKLKAYSTTPGSNNSAAPNGWPEGMLPSDVNNCAREMMARLAEWYQDAAWIRLDESIQSSTSSTIVVSGDVTATYLVGRPIRVNQSGSQVGYVGGAVYSSPNTTITVTGFTVSSPTIVEVGIIPSLASLPASTIEVSRRIPDDITAETKPEGDDSESIATTEYVDRAAAVGADAGYAEVVYSTTLTSGSGTWTKSSVTGAQAGDTVILRGWAGGGSGAATLDGGAGSRSAGGGGGGAYFEQTCPFADLPSSLSYAVGAGGAAVTRSTAGNTNGNPGGNTTLSGGAIALVANGGLGGQSDSGTSVAASGSVGYTVNGLTDGFVSYAGRSGGGVTSSTPAAGDAAVNGGAGGGAAFAGSGSPVSASGGTSLNGGAGGAGDSRDGDLGVNAVAAAGAIRGGGGGGASLKDSAGRTSTSGAGGRGEIQIIVVRGRRRSFYHVGAY